MLARASRLFRLLPAALAAAVLAGCGGSETDETKFIAQSRAEAVERTLDRIERDIADGDCDRAQSGVARLRGQVENFPERYDGRLVANVTQWVDHLDQQVPVDCGEEEQEEDETPTPTATPEEEETPEATVTPEATPTPVPTRTATPAPTQTPASPVEPPNGGGAAPDEDGVAP